MKTKETKKDRYEELRVLEEKANILRIEIKDIERKRKIEQEKKKEEFAGKIDSLLNSCKGSCIKDWNEMDFLGYDVFSALKEEGDFIYNWEERLEQAIENTKKEIEEETKALNLHIDFLQDFLIKLKNFEGKQK